MRFACLLLFLTLATAAHAETRTERYGTTIAIADGISVAFLGTGVYLIATNDSGGARTVGILSTIVGAGGYVWASPIVHHLRDRAELAKIDIGLRIFIPGLSAGIAAGVASCPNDEKSCAEKTRTILIAGGIGIAATTALDIAIFAKREVPYVAPTPGGAVVGLAGSF